jgi:nitrile hydratase subunit alpha
LGDGGHGWDEAALAELVTRDAMIGTGLPRSPTKSGQVGST